VVPFVPPWKRGTAPVEAPTSHETPYAGDPAGPGPSQTPAAAQPVAPWLRGRTAEAQPPVAPEADIEPLIVNIDEDSRGFYGGPGHDAPPPLAAEPAADSPARSASKPANSARAPEHVAPLASEVDSSARTVETPPTRRQRAETPPAPAAPIAVPVAATPRVNWRRTAAAVLVLVLIEGAAFGAAYWYVTPRQLGYLSIKSNVSGVEVLVDGRLVGRTPAAVELPPGRHNVEMRGFGVTKVLPVEIAAGVETTQTVQWPRALKVGRIVVKTTPPGARVLMGGEMRGVTPVTLENVPVGAQEIVVESDNGSVKSAVQVKADQVAEVDVGIFAGWLAVFAPVEIRVFEGGRLIGTSVDGRLLMKPGTHNLEMVNTSLGVRQMRQVEITPGRVTAVSLELAAGTIQVDAPAGTEIVIDGELKGTAPVDAISVPIGTREVVLRHPQIGQRRVVVTVGARAPARVSLLAPE